MRLRERRAEIERAGGSLAAVSVNEPADSRDLAKRMAEDGGPLGFPLLCDPKRTATKALGVYDAEHDMALPAILILSREGKVDWKYVGDDITDRPSEDDVIRALAPPPPERRPQPMQ